VRFTFDVDADADIDAKTIDATSCVAASSVTPPRVPHALAVRGYAGLRVYAQRSDGFRQIYSRADSGVHNVVAWGDANGDGIDEIADDGPGSASGWQLRIHGDRGVGITELQTFTYGAYSLLWLRGSSDGFDDLVRTYPNMEHVMCGSASTMTNCWTNTNLADGADISAAGDLDADGDDDVALGNRVYRRTGLQLEKVFDAGPTVGSQDLDWMELDGCERPELVDIVETEFGQPTTWRMWTWDGAQMVETTPVVPISGSAQLWWADFDSDGDADVLACMAIPTTTLVLYRHDGAAFVDTGVHYPTYDCEAAWGDYDADGDPDLAYTAQDGDNGALVLRRNDAGALVEVLHEPLTNEMVNLAWGRCGPLPTSPCFPSNSP
jgi:hypothetical protein